jgi:rhodanese-related sulfurtransferase
VIRDRLKTAAKKAALKFFKMEWEAEELAPNDGNTKRDGPQDFDPNLIPRVVDGSGDTPGPKHRERIGRTWLASQVISGVPGVIIDLRHPREVVSGLIPQALLIPGDQLRERLDLLPAKDVRVTLYDQTGGEASESMATWLRGQGWAIARMLQGGYAEWIEHDEPVARPEPPPGGRYHLGSPVELTSGERGYVQAAWSEGNGGRYGILLDDGRVRSPVAEAELRV